ncbi:MAG: glycosyltransferase [Bdellovibrionales bacterium]|nr:glycosyltransferase [Bdellovibrionales bacterium]
MRSIKTNIALISDDFFPAKTGVGVHLNQLASELIARGFNVTVLTSKNKNHKSEFEIINGVKVYRFRTLTIQGFPQALPTQSEIKKILLKEKIQIVHHHYTSFLMVQAFFAADKLQLPQISTYHFSVDVITQPLFMKPFKSLILKKQIQFLEKMKFLFIPSSKLLDQFKLKYPQINSIHISNFFKMEDFSENKSHLKQENFTILYSGRLATEKNIQLLIEAFGKLSESKKNVQLWIAGDGPLKKDLLEHATRLGVANQVKFWGHLNHSQLSELYKKADVFVLPSKLETFSLVCLEAMTFGLPLLLNRQLVSATEFVSQGKNGFLFDIDNSNELVQYLTYCYDNQGELNNMRSVSYDKSKAYNTNSIINKMIDHYRQVQNVV